MDARMPESARLAAHHLLGFIPVGADGTGPMIVRYEDRVHIDMSDLMLGAGMTVDWLMRVLAVAQGVHATEVAKSVREYIDGKQEDPDWLVGPPTHHDGQRFRDARRALLSGEDT